MTSWGIAQRSLVVQEVTLNSGCTVEVLLLTLFGYNLKIGVRLVQLIKIGSSFGLNWV